MESQTNQPPTEPQSDFARSFWPKRKEFFGLPRRVSRIFVILFIFSATINALLVIWFGWQQVALSTINRNFDQRVQELVAQSAQYKQERDDAQATAAEKSAELDKVNKQLAQAEKDLADTTAKLKAQEDQLAANSAELDSLRSRPPLFSFLKSTSRDVSNDESQVKDVVSAAYDTIAQVYGQPYLLHQITIKFVDQLTITGAVGEITISNSNEGISITISITSFDKNSMQDVNTIVHEIIHGFHGIAAFQAPVEEEGITVAATSAVIEKLYQQGVISSPDNFLAGLTDEQAANFNNSLSNPPGTSAFYSSPYVTQYYLLSGWTWQQFYQEDSNFFKNFNNAYYKHIQQGESGTSSLISSVLKQVTSQVNGQSTADYISGQITLNPV